MRRSGITETTWQAMEEQDRLTWNLLVGLTTFLLPLVLPSTGLTYLDSSLLFVCWLLPLLLVEAQRNFSKYDRKFAKKIAATVVVLVQVYLGSLIAAYLAYPLVAIPIEFLKSEVHRSTYEVQSLYWVSVFSLTVFAVAFIRASSMAIKSLDFERAIFVLPKKIAFHCFVCRPKALNHRGLLGFELLAIGTVYFGVYLVADVVKLYSKL
jgi:hypothetical protein